MGLLKKTNKSARHNFTASMLPRDRKTQFFDCCWQRKDLIFKSALVLLLFQLPFLAVKAIANLTYANMLATNVDAATTAAFLQIVSLMQIPCYAIMGLGFAAISRILRQLTFNEPIFFGYHMKIGLKQNGRRFLGIFLLGGIVLHLCNLSRFFWGGFIAYVPMIMFVAIFLPIGLYMLSQAVFYEVRFSKSFSNGIALLAVKLLPTLGFSLLIMSLGLIDYIPFLVIRILLYCVTLFALPVIGLGWLIFSCYIFDKTINLKSNPEIIGKGLYHPECD